MRKRRQVEKVDRVKVRFIIAWQDYELDEIAELPAEQARILIRRTIVVAVDEEPLIVKP